MRIVYIHHQKVPCQLQYFDTLLEVYKILLQCITSMGIHSVADLETRKFPHFII